MNRKQSVYLLCAVLILAGCAHHEYPKAINLRFDGPGYGCRGFAVVQNAKEEETLYKNAVCSRKSEPNEPKPSYSYSGGSALVHVGQCRTGRRGLCTITARRRMNMKAACSTNAQWDNFQPQQIAAVAFCEVIDSYHVRVYSSPGYARVDVEVENA